MAGAEPPIEEVPSKRLSKRPLGYYNLQEFHADHEEVGDLIVKSKTSWLSAEEICKILKQAESKNLTESVEKPPMDSIGLFIYREKQFYDHWMWNDAGGSKRKRGGDNRLGKKKTLSGNGCSVNVSESTGLLDDNYVRRVHRDYKNFGDELALVHYRKTLP